MSNQMLGRGLFLSLALLPASWASAEDRTKALAAAVPGFNPALIAEASKTQLPATAGQATLLNAAFAAAQAGQPLPPATPEELAQAYLRQANRAETCAYLGDLGAAGRNAAAGLCAAAPKQDSGKAQAPQNSAVFKGSENLDWKTQGALAFDGNSSAPGDPSARVAADPAPVQAPILVAADPAPQAPAPNNGIVAVSMKKLQEIAQKQVEQERSNQLQKAYNLAPNASLAGAGVFTVKVLGKDEVNADALKKSVSEQGAKNGQKVVFVRTNIKAQLFGAKNFALNTPTTPLTPAITLSFGLGGIIELVETRSIPAKMKDIPQHAERRVHLWPLTAEHLRTVMQVGDDLTVSGYLQHGSALGAGIAQSLGAPTFFNVGVGANAGISHSSNEWITLRILKIDPDHVRITIQKGDNDTLSQTLSATAGLNVYNDNIISNKVPTGLQDGFIGKLVVDKGGNVALDALGNLAQAQLSASWSQARDHLTTEGWASVPLSDRAVAAALDDLLKTRPKAMRALPPQATFASDLKGGRLATDIRDVTKTQAFQARLFMLKGGWYAGTYFYEVRSRVDDGPVKHYMVGTANSSFRGDYTKSSRTEQSDMWYDMNSGKAMVRVSLGPQDRPLATTREVVNDVVVTQRALGSPVKGSIKYPKTYVEFLGMSNFGKSTEDGSFVLSDEGVRTVRTAGRDQLIAAYLHADWLYEQESRPPEGRRSASDAPPPWAKTADPKHLQSVLGFMHGHFDEIQRLASLADQQDDTSRWTWPMRGSRGDISKEDVLAMWGFEKEYAQIAPGRWLRRDFTRFVSANAYAEDIGNMQTSEKPEQLIEFFLRINRDNRLELKRSIVATASLSGTHKDAAGKNVPNYAGYIELLSKRGDLKPESGPLSMPSSPIEDVNNMIYQWQNAVNFGKN